MELCSCRNFVYFDWSDKGGLYYVRLETRDTLDQGQYVGLKLLRACQGMNAVACDFLEHSNRIRYLDIRSKNFNEGREVKAF